LSYSAGEAAYKLAYEIAPITLAGGSASGVQGGMLSLLSFVQSATFAGLQGAGSAGLDDMFANFVPLPGSTLLSYAIGAYPFANMAVAANCTIAQPLNLAMLMRCPVRDPGGYAAKTAIMTGLQAALKRHCESGGTFNVATPSFFWTDLILLDLVDVSGGETLQAQVSWKWDFIKPLVTLQDASETQNTMMSKLSSGVQTDGALSGSSLVSGAPASIASAAGSPAATSSPGNSVPSLVGAPLP
jgi:hypothetical protein